MGTGSASGAVGAKEEDDGYFDSLNVDLHSLLYENVVWRWLRTA